MLLSIFCGVGGLDLGFENAGLDVGVAIDKNPDSVASYNHNRRGETKGVVADIRDVDLAAVDKYYGRQFDPIGVIGGPPCQSFSQANRSPVPDDPRHDLPVSYASLLAQMNKRKPIHFFVFENVPGLCNPPHCERFEVVLEAFNNAGFSVSHATLNAMNYSVPQSRERLFIVGYNRSLYGGRVWTPPAKTPGRKLKVKSAIADIPEPAYFRKGISTDDIPHHPNHWCMTPKSKKFSTKGALKPGMTNARSFKTLSWDLPSITVAYGHREVHIHPGCHRRLSVFEAMKLQGFPDNYELVGSLSSQIQQVSEAVPPPLAGAIARSVIQQLGIVIPERDMAVNAKRQMQPRLRLNSRSAELR